MTPTCYITGHHWSQKICGSFAEGCKGHISVVPDRDRNPVLKPGPAAVYGILRGCDKIIRRCEAVKRDYYHIDHGYFRRSNHPAGDFSGLYRVTLNAQQWDGRGAYRPDRWEAQKVEVRPWARKGRHIVVIPLTGPVAKFLHIDGDQWVRNVIDEVSRHTDRSIVVKHKGQGSLTDYLEDAWCLVHHSSSSAIVSLLAGIPAVTLGPSAARPMSTDITKIETPEYPDRHPWLWGLAYNHFSIDEFRDGTAWRVLTEDERNAA